MKVVLCSNSSWNIHNFRFPILKEFIKKKYKIYILCNKDNFTKEFDNLDVVFFDIKIKPNKINIFYDFLFLIRLMYIYIKIKPDYILNFTIKPVIYSSIVGKLLNIKVINTITGLGTTFLKGKILKNLIITLYRFSQKNIYKVLFQNSDDLKLFLDKNIVKNNNSDIVNGSGINSIFFSSDFYPQEKIIRFLFIGRIIKEKGINELIESIKNIKNEFSNTHFTFIGDLDKDNPSQISIDKINKWISLGYIEYIKFNTQIKQYIEKSSCIILPSYREGMPKSLLESMSMSRPIIATNVPGCRNLIFENYNGFLCEAKNSQSLTRAIKKFILLSQQKKIQFGNYSRKIIIDKYDEKLVINKYNELLKE